MTMIRKPFDELMTLPKVVDRFFEEPFFRPSRWFLREFEIPAVDVKATADEIEVKAALPGLKPEDVEVLIEGDMLTIKGSYKHEAEKEETGYIYRELSRGEFSRTIALPTPVVEDKAKATFADGYLTLLLPKAHVVKAHKVEVLAG